MAANTIRLSAYNPDLCQFASKFNLFASAELLLGTSSFHGFFASLYWQPAEFLSQLLSLPVSMI
jgi:hypothetical protein